MQTIFYGVKQMRKKRNPAAVKIAQEIIAAYKPESVSEMQDAIKDVFGPMFEAILNGEMENYLGYESNAKTEKATDNRRNGYSDKKLKTSMGETEISVPRDRAAEFESMLIPKHKRDVSEIDRKVLAMYSRGMSTRDISATIDDIYGFKLSAEQISKITDYVLEEQRNWQNRPLQHFYPFVFVDCLYVNVRRDYESKDCAVYTILAYDINGVKDILGLWIQETESKHFWAQIFDEIKSRGVEEIGFISMDGLSGLEDAAKAIFPDVVVQRCIVHLIRNSLKYVPTKDYKEFCAHLKKIYGAPSLKTAKVEFEHFCQVWSKYPGAVAVWQRNFSHVEQLFDFPSAVRKIMYTTNAIEAVNSGFRKVTKRGSFPNDDSVFKALFLRISEFYRKWDSRPVANWALVRNQLLLDERMANLFDKFDH
jgi:transposase-like protein